jgi:predicted PurR-regulated permease PerM
LNWTGIAASAAALAIAFTIIFLTWMLIRPLAIFLAAIVVAEALEPIVKRLERWVRRTLAIVLTYAAIVLVLVAATLVVIPTVLADLGALADELPDVEQIQEWLDEREWVSTEQITQWLEGQAGEGGQLAMIPLMVVAAFFEILLAIFLSFYWLIAKPGLWHLVHSVTPKQRREKTDSVITEVGATIGGYVRGVVIDGILLGTIAFIALTLIGIDFALPLAILVVFGEFIPIVGPVLVAIPALIIAAFEGTWQVIAVAGLFVGLQILQSAVTYPMIMKSQADIPPLLVLFALLAGGSVAGILGALVAIPLSGGIRIVILRVVVPFIQGYLGIEDQEAPKPGEE